MIRHAGDSALLLELEARIDSAVNARAIGIAAALARRGIGGVRDVVPTYRSVAVFFDPLRTRLDALTNAVEETTRASSAAAQPAIVEVPVVYGGVHGPDLPDVARFAGVDVAEVVRRHAGRDYRVFMLGFVPGFAYMGTVDDTIAMPRLAAPRTRVPAGSVAIAGRQTGIYPQETPGGWHLIGRTRVRPFDAEREPNFLVAAGDRVRFVPVATLDETGAPPSDRARTPPSPRTGGITVLRPGLLTTVQDLGRWGSQDRGVPVAGPMDLLSHRTANAALGNPAGAATLEVTLLGPELRFEQDVLVALGGADLSARLADRPVARNTPVHARAGDVLCFGERRDGARAYLAVAGGIATDAVLGSRATHVLSKMGGLHGGPLVAGDRLPLARRGGEPRSGLSTPKPARFGRHALLRVLTGPQDEFFNAVALDCLQAATFTVSSQSNRMAYRLTGATVPRVSGREMISDATFVGAIQIPPSGEPILLMADRQTSGGYPQIATVITADLPLAGQLAPGDTLQFRVCTRREAVAALLAQEGPLVALE